MQSPPSRPIDRFAPNSASVQGWAVISGFVLLTSLCLAVHFSGILNIAFPFGAFLVAAFLYQKHPILYLGFVWWIWFLTPFVRRVVDVQTGWHDPSPVLLAPFLVLLLTGITFIQHLPKLSRQDSLPFVLCIGSSSYGFLVGLVNNSVNGAVLNYLGWLTPVLLSFHIFVHWRDYLKYCRNTARVFTWGTLIMGSYGIVQYLTAPEWDQFWLRNLDTFAFGTPEPLGIRVFSTMHSPQPFGAYMMAGLLLLFGTQSVLKLPAAGVGYLSLLLSLARSAWLGWLAGLLILFPSLNAKFQIRLMMSILIMAILVVPLINMDPFAEVIQSRLQSLADTQGDVSYVDRAEGFNQLIALAVSEWVGKGLGYVIESNSLGSNDNGILTLLFSFGWLGAVPYGVGLVLLLLKLFQSSQRFSDPVLGVAQAVVTGLIIQVGLNVITAGVLGVLLWGFLGLGLAAQKHYRSNNIPSIRTR